MPKGLYGSEVNKNLARVGLVECLGAYIFFVAGTSVDLRSTDLLEVGFAFGLTLCGLIIAFGPSSGGHFNPAVTIGLAIAGKIGWKYAIVYVAAHVIAAIAASASVWLAYGDSARDEGRLGAVASASGLDVFGILIIELVITFFLVLIIMAVATNKQVPNATGGIAVGFVLVGIILVAGPLTGAGANPARVLGPMIMTADYTNWWAYILGEIMGGVLAAVLYDEILSEAEKPDSDK